MKIKIGGSASSISQLTDVDLTFLQNNQVLSYNETTGLWETKDVIASGGVSEELETIGFSIIANNNITIGNKGYRDVPYNCNITDWKIITDTSVANSIKINLSKTSDFSIFEELISTEIDKPQMVNSNFLYNNILNNWNTQINNNESLRFEIEEALNIKKLWFFMTIQRIV